jgi:hypothetical protein
MGPCVSFTTLDNALTHAEKADLSRVGAPVRLTCVMQNFKQPVKGLGEEPEILVKL